jgi:hypothetical protein
MFILDIGIALKEREFIDQILTICDEIEESLGKSRDSSGCGFGTRDMQFKFDTELQTLEAEIKVRRIFEKYNIKMSENNTYITYSEEEKK